MREKSRGERVWMLPVHEMPTADLLRDVLVVEHPCSRSVVRRRDDRIVEARKDDRRIVIRALSDSVGMGENFR